MNQRSKAGKNEQRFSNLFRKREPNVSLLGKVNLKQNEVRISVDESFEHDGITYLVEIDSGNMAKLLVGQYVLLNQLFTASKPNYFFLVVHTYKNYKPERTTKNLKLVNDQIYSGNGIPFGAMHIDDLLGWKVGIQGFLSKIQRA